MDATFFDKSPTELGRSAHQDRALPVRAATSEFARVTVSRTPNHSRAA